MKGGYNRKVYLVLLFCYDENFIGEHSPVTALVAFLMFEKRVN